MSSRWIVLVVVAVLTLIEFIGFSVRVYDWLAVVAIAALGVLEMRKFVNDRRAFRLTILIPVIIAIVYAIPASHSLSTAANVVLRAIGVLAILFYFFYSSRARDDRRF